MNDKRQGDTTNEIPKRVCGNVRQNTTSICEWSVGKRSQLFNNYLEHGKIRREGRDVIVGHFLKDE